MATFRTFIALETSEEARKKFFAIQVNLKKSLADVKWEREDKFHSTVKFLGDTDENVLSRINLIIKSIANLKTSFDLVFDCVGFFPNWNKPRVVWIGCSTHNPVVSQIKTSLDKNLTVLGFQVENKPFHPHITMGRIKTDNGVKHLLSIAENLTFEPITMKFNELILMKSVLKPEGSDYFVLERFGLGSQEK